MEILRIAISTAVQIHLWVKQRGYEQPRLQMNGCFSHEFNDKTCYITSNSYLPFCPGAQNLPAYRKQTNNSNKNIRCMFASNIFIDKPTFSCELQSLSWPVLMPVLQLFFSSVLHQLQLEDN